VRDSSEPGNRVGAEVFSAFISPEMFESDSDLPAARLGFSEVQIGHNGDEFYQSLGSKQATFRNRMGQGQSGCFAPPGEIRVGGGAFLADLRRQIG
jgi:hypothetical protein